MVPLSVCAATGGLVEYDACCDTATVDRLAAVTSTEPLPASTTTVVTRPPTVNAVAAG